MAWRRTGDKPLSEPRMESFLTHICVTRPQWVNGRKDLGHYDLYAMPSQTMACYSYPACLINPNEIIIELPCQRIHLARIMSFMSIKMLSNMAYMQYHLRWCHITAILQVWWTNLKSPLTHHELMSSSDSNFVHNEHEDVDQYDPYAIPSHLS